MPARIQLKPAGLATSLALAASTMLVTAPAKADISNFVVYITQSYTQDASGLSAANLSAQATVITNVKGEFDGGTVAAPDGSVFPVINQSSPIYPFDAFGAYFGAQPFGTFTANLTNSVTLATASATLPYSVDHYPDVAPRVGNYAALQHFDPTQDNSIVLASGFIVPGDAGDASTTFFIFDEDTNARLLQYSTSPGTTAFDVPANTATPGEKIGYYFESDIDYDGTVNGTPNVTVYRKITTGEINAAPVPEPASWALMLVGSLGMGALRLRRRAY
jgi:hypothetical protein